MPTVLLTFRTNPATPNSLAEALRVLRDGKTEQWSALGRALPLWESEQKSTISDASRIYLDPAPPEFHSFAGESWYVQTIQECRDREWWRPGCAPRYDIFSVRNGRAHLLGSFLELTGGDDGDSGWITPRVIHHKGRLAIEVRQLSTTGGLEKNPFAGILDAERGGLKIEIHRVEGDSFRLIKSSSHEGLIRNSKPLIDEVRGTFYPDSGRAPIVLTGEAVHLQDFPSIDSKPPFRWPVVRLRDGSRGLVETSSLKLVNQLMKKGGS